MPVPGCPSCARRGERGAKKPAVQRFSNGSMTSQRNSREALMGGSPYLTECMTRFTGKWSTTEGRERNRVEAAGVIAMCEGLRLMERVDSMVHERYSSRPSTRGPHAGSHARRRDLPPKRPRIRAIITARAALIVSLLVLAGGIDTAEPAE